MLTFSVIIPTFNRREKLLTCLDSLYDQTFSSSKFEIVVVDDASTDGTYEELSSHKITLLKCKKHLGRSKARNFGADNASGKYLVFTDSDCIAPKNWLEKLEQAYQTDEPGIAGAGGNVINKSTSIFGRYEKHVFAKYVKSNKSYVSIDRDEAPFALGNMSYLRSAFLNVGGFNEKIPDFVSHEDADLKERLIKLRKKFVYIPVSIIHNHDFGLLNFISQSLQRGAGMLLDSKKKGKLQSRLSILLRILVSPYYLIKSLVEFKFDLGMAFCDTIFYFFRNVGKLKYYSKVERIKI